MINKQDIKNEEDFDSLMPTSIQIYVLLCQWKLLLKTNP